MASETLLFLAPCTPWPHGTGMEQRAFAFLRHHAERFRVRLWLFPHEGPPSEGQMAVLRTLASEVHVVPPWVCRAEQDPFPGLAEAAARADWIHAVKAMVLTLPEHWRGRLLWDLDELPWHLRALRPGHLGALPPHPMDRDAFRVWVRRADRVMVSSSLELEPALLGSKGLLVPNVVVDPGFSLPGPEADVLLLAGNWSFPPNLDGLGFFLQQVLPRVRARRPSVRVRVAGRSPWHPAQRAGLRRAVDQARAEFLPDCPTMDAAYAGAAVALCPLRLGGGTRVRLVEAFARGCPAVSTSVGCEGLEVRDGLHLRVADEPEAFAEACCDLLEDPTLRRDLALRARARFEARHHESLLAEALGQVWEEAVVGV